MERNHHFSRRCELSQVVDLNDHLIRGGNDNAALSVMRDLITDLPRGYVVKDPRWCLTLDRVSRLWGGLSHYHNPVLVHLVRNAEDVIRSFKTRNEYVTRDGEQVPGFFGKTVQELYTSCRGQFYRWPLRKIWISYEAVLDAVESGDRKNLVKALGINEFGPFDTESLDLAANIIDTRLRHPTTHRQISSG